MGVLILEIRADKKSRLAALKSAPKKVWVLAIILALLGAGLGFVAGNSAPRSHSASTVILVTPLEGNPFYPGSRGEQLINLTTEAQVLKSDQVATKVIESLGSDAQPGDYLRRVESRVPANTQLIEITFEARRPEQAVLGAQSFAEAFLEFRSNQAATHLQGQIDGIRSEIEKLTKSMGELTQQVNDQARPAFERTIIEAQLSSGASQISALGARESTLATTRIDPGQIVTRAHLDQAALLGIRELFTIAGFLGGAILGFLLLLSSTRSSKVLRRAEELDSFGVTAMRVVQEPAGSLEIEHPALTRSSPLQAKFRSQLLGMVQTSNRRVLLLTPASESSAYPDSFQTLADTLVSSGLKTLIIDTTGKALPDENPRTFAGLGEVLSGQLSLTEAARNSNQLLWLVGQGDLINQYEGGLTSDSLNSLLIDAGKEFEVVLVVAQDLNLPITQWLVSVIPTVLVEVQLGTTRRKEVEAARNICVSLAAELKALLVRPNDSATTKTGSRKRANRAEHVAETVSGN